MELGKRVAAVAAMATISITSTSAATTSYCPVNSSGPCYSWGVPEVAASSGSGNVYFQLRAPSTYSWIGLGIGTQMRGADIFVVYTNGNGNVTLSTRKGVGEVMPLHVARSDITLLEGSGVVNGELVANVKCGKCSNLDLKGSTDWIAAWKEGSALNSANVEQQIIYHDSHAQFNVDFSKATVSADTNPFINSANTGSSSNNGASGSTGGVTQKKDNTGTLILAHGIVMTVVFAFMYPMGAILLPLIGTWFIHASWQMIAFLAMWAGLGIGYIAAHRINIFFSQTHTRLGIFVCALMALQPVLGWVHHSQYRKTQSRGVFSYIHVWYGRALMILGIINGGLGLKLAGLDRPIKTAFIVVAAVFSALYIATVLLKTFGILGRSRPSKTTSHDSSEERKHGGH